VVAFDVRCTDDPQENNNSWQIAAQLGTDPNGLVLDSVICNLDEDWFSMDITGGKTLQVLVETTSGPAPKVQLYKGTPNDAGNLVQEDGSTNTLKLVSDSASSNVTYFVGLTKLLIGDTVTKVTFTAQ
jgi:hypothetical protein